MEPNESFFPLRPFKEIRKLYNAMISGNYVTVTYRTDAGNKQYSGFVYQVGVDEYYLIPELDRTGERQRFGYMNLMKIAVGYILEHGKNTILSAITAEREKLMNRAYDDMVMEECADIYTLDGTIYDTKKIVDISLENIGIMPDALDISLNSIVMITECQKYGIGEE